MYVTNILNTTKYTHHWVNIVMFQTLHTPTLKRFYSYLYRNIWASNRIVV